MKNTSEQCSDEEYYNKQKELFNRSVGDLNKQDGYNCPLCKNRGVFLDFRENDGTVYETYVECKCMAYRKAYRRMKNSGLGDTINKYTFDNYITDTEWRKALKQRFIEFVNDTTARVMYIGGQTGCVDCDTEYFNGSAWVRIADYKDGDKVLQYNPDNGNGELVTPKKYIVADSEELFHIISKSRHIDMCLSYNHNFAYITRGRMRKKPLYDVMRMHDSVKQGFYGKIETAFSYSGSGIDLTDNEIRIMCAVIADGSFTPKQNKCSVNVKKERKKERMRELLRGVEYKEYEKANGYSLFRFYAPRREKEFSEYWYNCTQEQLKVVVDEVFEWDGHKRGSRRTFYSTSKQSADFVQFAISATGSRATIGVDLHRDTPCYIVCKSSGSSLISMRSKTESGKAIIEEVKPADGKQYCFTVESGYLILRRNGRIFITGNSGKTHLCTAVCSEYMRRGLSCYYMSWVDESKIIKANITNPDEYNMLVSRLKRVDVLYIDDFLKTASGEKPTKGDINLAFEIINYRYNVKDKVTIISSELSLNTVMNDVDEALAGRIYELSGGKYGIGIKPDRKKNWRLRGLKNEF